MCGIVGVLRLDGHEVCPHLLGQMVSQVRHRGPDAMGMVMDRGLGLGHARLSIIDVEHGQQPMANRSGSLTVTFNGEIFNYLELRDTLTAKGHSFRTDSDTEVILHAYQEYGEQCVDHFNGQWAFAIWDQPRGKLFLSRDRLGIRPLFHTTADGEFLFASEVKSLFANPAVDREIDPYGFDQLFTFWTTVPPRTIFQGICELPPGHNLRVENGQVTIWPYWQLDYSHPMSEPSESRCAAHLLELLVDSTRLRLRSDVPVGAYLSGGLDSSVTTALVRQCTDEHLCTFSVTFDDDEFDESRYQNALVRHLGTDHHTVHCSDDTIAKVFPEVIRHTEKPLIRTAPAPLFLLSKLVQEQGFKVVLTGEGADEILGGYDLFKEAKVRRFCAAEPESKLRPLLMQKLYPYLPNIQAQSVAYRHAFFRVRPGDMDNPLFSHMPRWTLTSQIKRFLSRGFLARMNHRDTYADSLALLPDAFGHWHPFCQAQFLETVMLMPGYILSSQGDRMAMAHSVEARFPFLDHRLVQFAARLPPRLKMKGLNEKYLLKRAAGHLVPDRIVHRTKQPYRAPDAKSFFNPTNRSARQEYVEELLSPDRVESDGVFQPAAVQQLVRKAREGRLIGTRDNLALVGILSTQLVLEQFVHHFVAEPGPARPSATVTARPGDSG